MPAISVIVPAYNEDKTLEAAVLHTYQSFQSLGIDFELIIVNDNSTDRTGAIADSLAQRFSNVQSVHQTTNTGIGGAFRAGITHAGKDYVIFVPVDNPLDRDDIETYFKQIQTCDIVAGCRVERVGYTPFARVASFIYNRILVPLLFNIAVADANWIQVYRRELFTKRVLDFKNDRIFFLVEILVLARKNNLIIAEVPAKMKQRFYGKPTSTRFSIIALTLCDMARFFWNTTVRNNKS
jgi:dolichol-phosphate mannosyltransferase